MSKHVENHRQFLDSKLAQVNVDLDKMLEVIANSDRTAKIPARDALRLSAQALQGGLLEVQTPSWLVSLINVSTHYNPGGGGNRDSTFLMQLIDIRPKARRQKWTHLEEDIETIDFEEVYSEAAGDIKGLFDKLIVLLQTLINNKAVDSAKVIRELELLIAILKKNNSDSFFQKAFCWLTTRRNLYRLLRNYGASFKITAPLVQTIEETAHEVDDRFRSAIKNGGMKINHLMEELPPAEIPENVLKIIEQHRAGKPLTLTYHIPEENASS
ncbi:MAG: hypothetical protein SGJ20_07175 [Planctomycetota bacterium]|nr:hypothetical protein [Planctomycetota bacterium]